MRKGDVLARIADLTAFRVEATVSDVHAGRSHVGMPARVAAGERMLHGPVSERPPDDPERRHALSRCALDEPPTPVLRPEPARRRLARHRDARLGSSP